MDSNTQDYKAFFYTDSVVKEDNTLPDISKLIFSDIAYFCFLRDGKCVATNQHFAKKYGKSNGTISKAISALYDKGYIERIHDPYKNRWIYVRRSKFAKDQKTDENTMERDNSPVSYLNEQENNQIENSLPTDSMNGVSKYTNLSKTEMVDLIKKTILNERITLTIRELIYEVFSEIDHLSDDDMAFTFLDSIRFTELEEMKSDFKLSVKSSLKEKLQYHPIQDHLYVNRQLQLLYVEKLVDKTLELISLKILNTDNSIYKNGMGEFLYEGYAYIDIGNLVSNKIFMKESIGMKNIISGRVVSKRIQTVKGGKDFAYLTIDDYNDGPKLNILVSTALYEKHKTDFIDIEGKSIGAHGEIKYNNFLKSNIFKAFDLEIQKGYVIDREIV